MTTSVDIETEDGQRLEGLWSPAASPAPLAVAVVTHPHPLMGGDMHNPVPAGLARGLPAVGISVLRFGFRGTGASTGAHGGGRDEVLDVLAGAGTAGRLASGIPVVAVGYSFGADVVLAAPTGAFAAVVAVAPPLRVLPPAELGTPRGGSPTLLLVPAHDQFCDPSAATAAVEAWPDTVVEAVPGTDHFLAGGIDRVVDRTAAFLQAHLGPR